MKLFNKMLKKPIFSLLFLISITSNSISAQYLKKDTLEINSDDNGCIKPNLLPSHPFGLFISRINHNLNISPPSTIKLNFDLGNANVWLPEVKLYQPNDPSVAKHLSQFSWDKRDSVFQAFPRSYDSALFNADGVIKTFNINVRIPISKSFELAVCLRSFLLTQGNIPISFFTNDDFIEFFHSNIAGGEDPFARKIYGLNKAGINYQDFKGNKLNISNGQFIVPGIQFNLHYYLKNSFLTKHKIYVNSGLHIGLNTSQYNRSLDLGISGALQKQINLGTKHQLKFALAGSILQQRIANLGSEIEFSSNNYFLSHEMMFEYRKQLKNNRFWQIGLNFYYQSAYNKRGRF